MSASKKEKDLDASLGLKKDGIDIAGASEHLAFGFSTSQGAGHDSSRHLIDDKNTKCPYHTLIVQEPLSYRARETSAITIDRFMIHNPGEQYALFNRPDNKRVSIYRECICFFLMDGTPSSSETEHTLAGEETDLLGFQVGL